MTMWTCPSQRSRPGCRPFGQAGKVHPTQRCGSRRVATHRTAPVRALQPPVSPPTYDAKDTVQQRPKHRVEHKAPADEKLDWKRQWYPVMPIRDVDPKAPHAVTILGKQLVVWQDSNKDCHVFEDKCPHRLVALSEGRVEGDELMCSYHGWRFNGSGECTQIPQLFSQNDTTKSKIVQTSAACAKAFPTASMSGLLWVWMSDSNDRFEEALQAPLPEQEKTATGSTWYSRTVPMAWEMLAENLTDPSHVPFSHHGVAGNRNALTELEFIKTESNGVKGYKVYGKWIKSKMLGKYTRQVVDVRSMPSAIELRAQVVRNPDAPEAEWEGTDMVTLHFRLAPVTRITSRIIFNVTRAFSDTSLKARIMKKVMPEWTDHIMRATVLDGDAVFLHRQSVDIMNGKASPEDYFLPARSDRTVHALWAYLQKYAPAGADFYHSGVNEDNRHLEYWPRERILDRYEQHVKNCKMCSDGLHKAQFGQLAATIIGAAALVNLARLATIAKSLVTVQSLVSVAIAGLAGLCWAQLRKLIRHFTYADYVHAEHD